MRTCLLVLLGLAVGCGDDSGRGSAEPAETTETGTTEAETTAPARESPEATADEPETDPQPPGEGEETARRPARLNQAFVGDPPETPDGFTRYEHDQSCKEHRENLILERFTVDHPSGLSVAPCGDGQTHSYAMLHAGEDERARRIALGAANGRAQPQVLDVVVRQIAQQLDAEVEPSDAEPMIVHGSELTTRNYALTGPDDAPRLPGRWALRTVVVPRPYTRNEDGMVEMGGPQPGLLVLLYEPVETTPEEALEAARPMLETLVSSVRFGR